jgi:CRISPR-associated endonuclease/helicase Cas3
MAGPSPVGLFARPGQLLHDHLVNVATLSETFAATFNAASWGKTAGLLHDIGKASSTFQRRVRGESALRVDHSTFGARHANETWKGVGKLLAYCVAGHHSGLPDGASNEGACLKHRLDPARRVLEDASSWRVCLGELAEIAPPAALPFDTAARNIGFKLAFFLRMVFSCLVDADRLDAEAVGDSARADQRSYPNLATLAERLDARLGRFGADTPVRRIRAEVLAACREAAEHAPGLFSLTVPTGGGKTLSSLAFALRHALRHGLERVVYVIPFTSIIEQNARVFREALGDTEGDFVVEHHSNLAPTGDENDDRPHPATENWDAPIIVTTAVQFFESLYSARAGCCRKLHNLANSVVILDEAQMLPLTYLRPCVEALRELTATYGASVVLCTATQPALNAPIEDGDGLKGGLTGVREIIPDPVALYGALKRVEVRHVGRLADSELAARLAAEEQALCIVPTRRMARELFGALLGMEPEGVFHLSALMCPRHRTEVLDRVRAALAEGRPCRVVSTTLVEAGVDLDFPVVYRAEAGIDSVAQAAGRCNREGLRERGRVYVFEPEAGLPPGVFRRSAQAGRSVAERHTADLLHPDAVRDYFLELYWRAGDEELDAKHILTPRGGESRFDFPFREIERSFQFIDTPTQGLIIPYDDEGRALVRRLAALGPEDRAGGLLRRVQRHTVSLYARDFERLEVAGALRRNGPGGQFFVLANMGLYDARVGLDLFRENPGVYAPEDLVS